VTTTTLVHSILNWLRAGYPEGVPDHDRVPLLELLRNTPLSEDQVKEVVREIVEEEAKAPAGHEIDHDEIEKFIEGVAHHDGGPENVKRVAAKLAAAGWPLHGVDETAVTE
jgi:endonuclease III